MTVSARTLQLLMQAGVEGDALLEIVRSMEADCAPAPRSANAERQARHRERVKALRNNVTDNVTEGVTPPPERPSTPNLLPSENNQNLPPIVPPSAKRPARSSEGFEEFWKAYPRRDGANPKQPALKAYQRQLACDGVDSGMLISAARKLAADNAGKDAKFIPMAATWLNQQRYFDDLIALNSTGPPDDRSDIPRFATVEEHQAWWREHRKATG